MKIAEKIIRFNQQLNFSDPLPDGIRIMNPYAENPEALQISSEFYRKYYADNKSRRIILGINPGRFGAGVTGIPFTDPKQLKEHCKLDFQGKETHELSSAFVYEMISAFGGASQFYAEFYIGAVCPLGFVIDSQNGKEKNYNYYDSRELLSIVEPFIIKSLEAQLSFGINRDVCYCLGNGKNYKYLLKLNKERKYFEKIVPLEHPRYIMQYKLKKKEDYVRKYLKELREIQ
ncbi:MAG: DUF4918 family protein [Bacteroidales bacterium]|nr:DUF4918 family protein [Bacteroidales bacterium]MCF8455495.1 DUF4918 family protein [Bacteroidales bacterium]